MMRRRRFLPVVALVMIVPLATGGLGCQRVRDRIDRLRERAPVVDRQEGVKAAAERLARELAAARTIGAARPAARAALAWSGFTVVAPGNQRTVAPIAPRVPLTLPAGVADNLALDHVDRQGFTLAQIGTLMANHPLVGRDLAFLRDGRVLLEVLRRSLGKARRQPNDPRSFVPLYLSASISARTRQHVQASQVRPEQVTLTNFDLLLFASATRRGATARGARRPPKRASLRDLLVPPAHAGPGGPCSWIQDEFGDEMGEFVKGELTTIAGGALDAGWAATLDRLEGMAKEAADKAASAAGTALSWITFLVSVVGMYGGYSITIDPDPEKTHMCHSTDDGGDPHYPDHKVHFVAKVSSRPLFDERLQKCLDLLGVDLPDKDSAKSSKVRWGAGPMFDKFGEFDMDGLAKVGYGLGRLEQFVDDNGQAKVQVTIKEEEKNAKKEGKLTRGSLVVKAELFTQKANGAKLAMAVVTRGIPDVMRQWLDKAFPKSAQGTMAIDYHTKRKMKCEKTFSKGGMNYTLKAKPKDGLYGPWDGTLTGTLSQHGITGKFDATMSFTIPENGSGEVTGTHSYKSSFKKIVLSTDMVISGTLNGTARIGDPDGLPTLVLRVGGMNTKLSAKGRGIQGERLNYQKTDNSGGGEAEFVCELREQ